MTDRLIVRAEPLRPFTQQEVLAMGLAVDDQVCTIRHVPRQKPHRHIALPVPRG